MSKTVSKQKPRVPQIEVVGAVMAPLPRLIAPQLATLVKEVPAGPPWIYEIKFDGYRMVCRIENGGARLFSRNGKDWTEQFAYIATAATKLPVDNAWLDGEVVVLGPDGRSSFQRLKNVLGLPSSREQMYYYVFDLAYLTVMTCAMRLCSSAKNRSQR